jgi:hypothetical protein
VTVEMAATADVKKVFRSMVFGVVIVELVGDGVRASAHGI